MRHRNKGAKLGRTQAHRKATLASLSSALIEHKKITTTLPKAKALRPFIEPLITRAKVDSTHNRRQVFRHLRSKDAVDSLFFDVAEVVGDRPGGYTRIIKLGRRPGDGAEMAMIELVDYNDVKPETGSSGRSRTRRGSGKGRRKKKDTTPTASQESTTPDTEAEAAATEATDPDVVKEETAVEEASTETGAPDEDAKATAGDATNAETPEAEASDTEADDTEADDEKKDA
ncbi:MAG: 50S ribosomal protein L17 [Bacteroidetes bacterium]|jgi:large subunit ribosomal protein L17|nr:50S ribosomal protein L17 [Bacteroidota bacterium]